MTDAGIYIDDIATSTSSGHPTCAIDTFSIEYTDGSAFTDSWFAVDASTGTTTVDKDTVATTVNSNELRIKF